MNLASNTIGIQVTEERAPMINFSLADREAVLNGWNFGPGGGLGVEAEKQWDAILGGKLLVTGMIIVQTENTDALQDWKHQASFLTRNNAWHTVALQ